MSDTRWVATYERDGRGWRAQAEPYRATKVDQRLTCPHRHRSQKAAQACADSMVDDEHRIAI